MRRLLRLVRALPLLLLAPLLLFIAGVAMAVADLLWAIWPRRRLPPDQRPSTQAASIVIPTWNGRDLVERYLATVVDATSGNPENEIILVDNASEDGTADYVRERFPSVRVLRFEENLGFGGGSNAGFRAAKNDIVVLLNNDMRVERGFLRPLLDGFTDERVFSVSCQIFFSDPTRRREETGLSQGCWKHGLLRVGHRVDDDITDLFPCFYGGGGSTAYDRKKFLQLGGFDPVLAPFYLEDTDLGYMAWKRGWKVLYQPRSVVYHEHRGTIGRKFSEAKIQAVLAKNFVLWTWKNIHEWPRLSSHLFLAFWGAALSLVFGTSLTRVTTTGIWRAVLQLPGALRSRWRARNLSLVNDTEAFLRPMGAYFRDRFDALPAAPERLRVLFVSPYPILPPVHGGGVFMYQTLVELARRCELHLIVLLHYAHELEANQPLRDLCASAEFLVKKNDRPQTAASALPHAVREFASEDLEWLIHRQAFVRRIDVLQLEYTPLAQYAGRFRHLVCALFEHDVYFQSVGRSWPHLLGACSKLKAAVEYLRALRYETTALKHLDLVQACSRENTEYLLSFVPSLRGRIESGMRAGVDTSRYSYSRNGREPGTMLFVGSFRHLPNQAALRWFTTEVLPLVCSRMPEARLVVVGSDPPPPHAFHSLDHVELLGAVDDIREPLSRYSVFVCPVLSGSGVRVKLLEAFAAGIPAVSTRLGAEGLATEDGTVCLLADDPGEFAVRVLALLQDAPRAEELARRARAEVEANWNLAEGTNRLVESYRSAVCAKRAR